MEKGTLIEFRQSDADKSRRRLAVIDRPEGKKNWIAIDERGHAHTLHPRQLTYTVSGQTFQPSEISEFWQKVQSYLDPSSLEVAWELLIEDGESVDPAGMAMLLFSDQSPMFCYVAYCLLSEDKLFFKQKGDRYEPRPASQVNELRHQAQVEAQRQQEWQNFLSRLKQRLQAESGAKSGAEPESESGAEPGAESGIDSGAEPIEWQSSDRPRLEALERFALLGEEATHRTPALETLAALGRPETADAAFQLLVALKIWSHHENLFLRRSQHPTQFPQRIQEMVARCLTSPPPDPDLNRLDLTHLKVYTIDDESTREIDDGLSIEFLDNGQQRLWIHIADPSRWVLPGDDLDLEARRRCTTLYLPTGMIPMFPSELATGPMSLTQGKVCSALSFGVILDEQGQVQDYQIQATSVKPTYRLTYEDVDELLELEVEGEPELTAIATWAKRRTTWRQSQGAISIHMPESSIKVQDDEIIISVLDDSQSRSLVAEMMILAGEVAGRYGEAHQLALPFRGQPQPELPSEEELLQLPAGPVRDCAIRRCMPRSEVSITPFRHASLGLDTYTQVTSPIRRYADLLAHFQIKAHLRGESLPFSIEATKDLIQAVSNTAYEATLVERQTNRYWALEYLRRHPEEIWQSLMLRWLREHEGLGLLLLEDLGLEMAMHFNRPIEVGDRLAVKVTYADPRQDIIRFAEISQSVA
ncbi:MAG: ribonuclease R [Oculatellaceae cyanobacterium Prado106]|jgi:exoribonuclease-2|nr:ribonuclease R [Oculatellaceae cyanobacterium Prado106]